MLRTIATAIARLVHEHTYIYDAQQDAWRPHCTCQSRRRILRTITLATVAAIAAVVAILALNIQVYDAPMNAGIETFGVGYEWRGDPGWFVDEDSPFWNCHLNGNHQCGPTAQ